MSDPEMCVSGWDFSGLSGVLDDKKIRIETGSEKWICKASLYSSSCSASDSSAEESFSPIKRKKAVLFIRKEGLLTFVGN
ncbi:MAG: hypothetical protein II313_03280 [Anaerotignum sp.]|nr:hypothetical protein [Anaerotignum sp.]